MGRSPRRSSQVVEGLNRGAWTSEEDKTLIDYVKSHGEGKWSNVSKVTGLRRCGKSCRLRWMNYLRPDIKRGNISVDEEELILRLHKLLGNRWALIAGRLPGRTDNEVKNYWNTHLAKKAQDQTLSISTSPQAPQNLDKFTNTTPLAISSTPPPPPSAAAAGDHHLAPPQPQVPEPHRNHNYDQSSMLSFPNGMIDNATRPGSSDRSSPLTCGDADDSGQDFVMDFNIDDIYQILDPGFARLDGAVLSDLNISVANPHHRQDDREHAKPGTEIGSDTDLRSLASFLDSEEWLGDEDHLTVTCKEEQVGR